MKAADPASDGKIIINQKPSIDMKQEDGFAPNNNNESIKEEGPKFFEGGAATELRHEMLEEEEERDALTERQLIPQKPRNIMYQKPKHKYDIDKTVEELKRDAHLRVLL